MLSPAMLSLVKRSVGSPPFSCVVRVGGGAPPFWGAVACSIHVIALKNTPLSQTKGQVLKHKQAPSNFSLRHKVLRRVRAAAAARAHMTAVATTSVKIDLQSSKEQDAQSQDEGMQRVTERTESWDSRRELPSPAAMAAITAKARDGRGSNHLVLATKLRPLALPDTHPSDGTVVFAHTASTSTSYNSSKAQRMAQSGDSGGWCCGCFRMRARHHTPDSAFASEFGVRDAARQLGSKTSCESSTMPVTVRPPTQSSSTKLAHGRSPSVLGRLRSPFRDGMASVSRDRPSRLLLRPSVSAPARADGTSDGASLAEHAATATDASRERVVTFSVHA